MIEVYVMLTLVGVGYFLNQNRPVATTPDRQVNVNEMPTPTTPYSSNHIQVAKDIEQKKAKTMFDQSMDSANSRVIPSVYKPATVTSLLAGVEMPKEEFTHNNQVPFFRGSLRQNINPDVNKHRLEYFTGQSANDIHIPKREIEPLFVKTANLNYMNGAPTIDSDRMKSYIHTPTIQNNVLPFKQVKVGPGLNKGFDSKPVGGYQQFDVQEIAKPKTVDELRVATNPKVTYDGRIIEGQKGTMRGKIGTMEKNRATTFYENGPERYLRTTGARLKEAQHGKYTDKTTARQTTTREYAGGAYQPKEQVQRGKYREAHRNQLGSFALGNLSMAQTGRRDDTDYGKKNILVYANERDVTTTRTYQGNLTSIVKAIIAPIEDIFKVSKKEYMVDNPRTYGQMHAQVPSALPALDPNDTARTTLKETLVQEADLLNLRGATQITVYDADDVARTTIKETTLQESEAMNLKGQTKSVVFDPNDVPRVTIKETTIHDTDVANLKGPVRTHVYDPNDIARTTIKETLIHDGELMNVRGDRTAGYAYNPDVKARQTVRETLDCVDNTINMAVARFVGSAQNPDEVARTTVKETTMDGDYIGIVAREDRVKGAYTEEQYDMKQTHKEYLSNREYMGGVANAQTDGYKVSPTDMKQTLKEGMSDIEYFGNAADQSKQVSMSYQDMYNACISELRENTLVGREPTKEGAKSSVGTEAINMEVKKIAGDEPSQRLFDNKDRIVNNLQQIDISTLTRGRNVYDNQDRLTEVNITKTLQDNPYINNPIHSAQASL